MTTSVSQTVVYTSTVVMCVLYDNPHPDLLDVRQRVVWYQMTMATPVSQTVVYTSTVVMCVLYGIPHPDLVDVRQRVVWYETVVYTSTVVMCVLYDIPHPDMLDATQRVVWYQVSDNDNSGVPDSSLHIDCSDVRATLDRECASVNKSLVEARGVRVGTARYRRWDGVVAPRRRSVFSAQRQHNPSTYTSTSSTASAGVPPLLACRAVQLLAWQWQQTSQFIMTVSEDNGTPRPLPHNPPHETFMKMQNSPPPSPIADNTALLSRAPLQTGRQAGQPGDNSINLCSERSF
ncbi:hypothetical protein J6590_099043 [Homalodisca vitripennis]|nr:hypothetical protein J6590_099043 [Homalodisca vitripennis]